MASNQEADLADVTDTASPSSTNEAKSVAGKIWLLLHVLSTSCCCWHLMPKLLQTYPLRRATDGDSHNQWFPATDLASLSVFSPFIQLRHSHPITSLKNSPQPCVCCVGLLFRLDPSSPKLVCHFSSSSSTRNFSHARHQSAAKVYIMPQSQQGRKGAWIHAFFFVS